MRQALDINLAYMLNSRGHVAMSYPDSREASLREKLIRLFQQYYPTAGSQRRN